MATTPPDELSLSDMLLERLEKTTDSAVKSQIMKRLELCQFMESLDADRDRFLKQIRSDAVECSNREPFAVESDEVLLRKLRQVLGVNKQCRSKHEMALVKRQASLVLAEVIVSIWSADAELKCGD
jgi:hypothetical protein